MQQARLLNLLKQPEVQRQILGDYRGAYGLGVALDPVNRRDLVIQLWVEGEDTGDFPDGIELAGEWVPIIVSPNFRKPVALPHIQPVAQ